MHSIVIRDAIPNDWPAIAEYNCRLAWETEQKQLDRPAVERGVQAVLADPAKGRYFVAAEELQIVGQLMITWEWSDWRNGNIWWLQSVYVHPDFRRSGIFRRLYEHARAAAAGDPSAVAVRLYVEQDNHRAQQTYRSLGMSLPGYVVMEEMLTGSRSPQELHSDE